MRGPRERARGEVWRGEAPQRITTRALVLARGLGTRMRAGGGDLDAAQTAAADTGIKAMIPFGRPFLDHVLHSLAEAGLREVGLVLGPEHGRIRDYYRSLATRRLSISFVTQLEPLGTADAVASAREWAGDAPFLVMNADNIYPVGILRTLAAHHSPSLPGFEPQSLELPPARIGEFALVERGADGCLTRIVEKPGEQAIAAAGRNALISMNVWHFDRQIFEACRDVPQSSRGERELPGAVGLAAARGICFDVFPVRGRVLDLSRRSDVAEVSRHLDGAMVEL